MTFTRRHLLLSMAATAASLAAPAARASGAWQARHGMSSQQYQATFDNLVGQGYRLTHVDGYTVGGWPQFAAIWDQGSGPGWIARHDLTSAQFQAEFNQRLAQGYRLLKVSGYEGDGEALYAAIWTQAPGPAFQARHGMTGDHYQHVFDSLVGQGYRQTWISGYVVRNRPLFAAIFEKIEGPAWYARFGLTSDEYQAEFDRLTAQDYVLCNVSGYVLDGAPQFAAIWESRPGVGFQARHNMSSGEYQSEFNRYTRAGMRLADVSGYGVDGGALYAALWLAA